MAKLTGKPAQESPEPVLPAIPRMFSLDQVCDMLNLNKPLVYQLVRTGELPAGQFGGRGVWRVREPDLTAYVDSVFATTAEKIAQGLLSISEAAEDD